MNAKERREHERLTRKWIAMRATKQEISRCMELDRQAAAERARWAHPSIGSDHYIERKTADGLWSARATDNGDRYRRPWTASYEGPGTPKGGVGVRGRSGRLLHFASGVSALARAVADVEGAAGFHRRGQGGAE